MFETFVNDNDLNMLRVQQKMKIQLFLEVIRLVCIYTLRKATQ